MVCAGITYDAENNRITVEYDAADGSRGASFSDPYIAQDLVDTIANITKQGENQIYIPYAIYIIGSSTYFVWEDVSLYFDVEETYVFKNINQGRTKWINTVFDGNRGKSVLYSQDYGAELITGCCIYKAVNWVVGGIYYDIECKVENTLFRGGSHVAIPYCGNVKLYNLLLDSPSYYGKNNPLDSNNITIVNSKEGIYLYAVSDIFTLNNIRIYNCTYDVRFRLANGQDKVLNLIDSMVNLNNVVLDNISGTMNAVYTCYNKTTFNATIENGGGGELTIEDKDGNVVYEEALSSEDMTEQIMAFQKYVGEYIDEEPHETLIVYDPFTLKVTKSGYQPLKPSPGSHSGRHKPFRCHPHKPQGIYSNKEES